MIPSKRKMYAILAGVGISLGAAGIASAASTSSTTSNAAAVATAATTASTVESTPTDPTTAASTPAAAGSTTATDANSDPTPDPHAPTWTSSVTIAVPADGSKPTDAQLQAVATVTADQASAAALANTPGTVGTAELKSIAGNVVWVVDVTATAGGSVDVIIDGGNSTVLATHPEGGPGHGGGHGDMTPTWTSSVTIAASTDGSEPTDAQLQAVATVTADQATAAALANSPGTAGTAELKSIAGNVVWVVDITATDGGSLDVVVDAGNSTVLASHPEGGHGGGDHHPGGGAPDATTTAAASTTG